VICLGFYVNVRRIDGLVVVVVVVVAVAVAVASVFPEGVALTVLEVFPHFRVRIPLTTTDDA